MEPADVTEGHRETMIIESIWHVDGDNRSCLLLWPCSESDCWPIPVVRHLMDVDRDVRLADGQPPVSRVLPDSTAVAWWLVRVGFWYHEWLMMASRRLLRLLLRYAMRNDDLRFRMFASFGIELNRDIFKPLFWTPFNFFTDHGQRKYHTCANSRNGFWTRWLWLSTTFLVETTKIRVWIWITLINNNIYEVL